jgi:hypothetical protein
MKIIFRAVTEAFAAGLLGVLFATQASAGCNYPDPQVGSSPNQRQPSGRDQGQFIRTAFSQNSDQDFDEVPITGLWKFSFTAEGNTDIPDDTPIDKGYVQWHADGTELMNSFRAPTTGQFCMGVWKRVGRFTYKLNHFALGWNFDASAPMAMRALRIPETGFDYLELRFI